ncbi:hypothetical protein ACI2KL_27965, partial [Pseudomonas yamanorum]|uniref:hypothetical protein n=1 Tax=Pseudomonas yamanorum TaxID=515393 RepID=UPI00384E884E
SEMQSLESKLEGQARALEDLKKNTGSSSSSSEGRLPAGAQTTPMTYTGKDGKQYVLVMAGGHGSLGTKQGDYVMAFKLPD